MCKSSQKILLNNIFAAIKCLSNRNNERYFALEFKGFSFVNLFILHKNIKVKVLSKMLMTSDVQDLKKYFS